MEKNQYSIISSQSMIEWVGRKVTGAHNGTIAIKEGTLLFNDEYLTGGRFVIDTQSIKILDITDPGLNAQLAGHLASDDFFGSAKYPEATFEISHTEPHGNGFFYIVGDLTIKGITHPMSFVARINHSENSVIASGKITVDHTKFGIKYGSGKFFQNMGDNLIYNNFDLNTTITAKAVTQFTNA